MSYRQNLSMARGCWQKIPMLLLVLVLLNLLNFSKCDTKRVLIHYGGCSSSVYGSGKCLPTKQCEFYNLDVLDKEQCVSQLRSGLICCPNSQNVLPGLSARVEPSTNAPTIKPDIKPDITPGIETTSSRADWLPTAPYCGVELGYKIYGGTKTNILEFPWTALMQYTTSNNTKYHNCGGSFIAERWVLTAAHCVVSQFIGGGLNLTGVRLGEWDQTTDPDCISYANGKRDCVEAHVDVGIDRILAHDEFDILGFSNDIALVRLERPIIWAQHQHIKPICLPLSQKTRDDRLENVSVDVAGWGRTEFDDTRSMVKRKAMLRVWELGKCQPLYAEFSYKLDDTQMCASGGHGIDTCRGDSGGPLMVQAIEETSYFYQAGIVSYGKVACGQNNFPGVYTRVAAFLPWIREQIRLNSN